MLPTDSTFSNLISTEGNLWNYHIPRFQREYVWGKHNWSKLLEDIYENEPGHYMGSIICVHESSELGLSQELIYDVVDGQQRLTTLSILLMAIYHKLNNPEIENRPDDNDDEYIIAKFNIKKRLMKEASANDRQWGVFRSGGKNFRFRVLPSTQGSNLEDYHYIMGLIGVVDEIDYPSYCGNRRLLKAFNYFLQNIPNDYKGLIDLIDRIYRLSFIHISETSQAKAFLLFETLNFRGVPLSAIDIIKNKMLATLEMKHNQNIEDAYDQWQRLLEYLPEDSDQDRFLRQFYNAFKYDSTIKVPKIPKATSSTVIAIYENLIKRDAKEVLNKLIEKAKIYHVLIEPDKYSTSKLNLLLIDLERMGGVSSYTFLLFLFSLSDSQFSDPMIKEKTLDLFVKYYFRRNITDFPNTRELDGIYFRLIEACLNELDKGNKLSYEFINEQLVIGKGRIADLSTLKEYLGDNLFYNNSGMARYALTKLDEMSHNREYAPNLWERNEKGLYVWTVEHIFPQGSNIPKVWIDMIGGGSKEKAEEIQSECVHCLGNLTLSGYNSRLSNHSFEKKRKKTEANIFGNKIQIGYKNGLALNNIQFEVDGERTTLAESETWTREHIIARNEKMVEMLTDFFSFDFEK